MTYGPHIELNVIVSEHARFHHSPLYAEIVRRAHKRGLAGASVFRGIEGFGHSQRVHEAHVIELAAHTPVMLVIVDAESRIREFLPELRQLVGDDVVVTLRTVELLAPAIGRR